MCLVALRGGKLQVRAKAFFLFFLAGVGVTDLCKVAVSTDCLHIVYAPCPPIPLMTTELVTLHCALPPHKASQ